jgi:hypothetical protein
LGRENIGIVRLGRGWFKWHKQTKNLEINQIKVRNVQNPIKKGLN